jgi:hypothetical protein
MQAPAPAPHGSRISLGRSPELIVFQGGTLFLTEGALPRPTEPRGPSKTVPDSGQKLDVSEICTVRRGPGRKVEVVLMTVGKSLAPVVVLMVPR